MSVGDQIEQLTPVLEHPRTGELVGAPEDGGELPPRARLFVENVIAGVGRRPEGDRATG